MPTPLHREPQNKTRAFPLQYLSHRFGVRASVILWDGDGRDNPVSLLPPGTKVGMRERQHLHVVSRVGTLEGQEVRDPRMLGRNEAGPCKHHTDLLEGLVGVQTFHHQPQLLRYLGSPLTGRYPMGKELPNQWKVG